MMFCGQCSGMSSYLRTSHARPTLCAFSPEWDGWLPRARSTHRVRYLPSRKPTLLGMQESFKIPILWLFLKMRRCVKALDHGMSWHDKDCIHVGLKSQGKSHSTLRAKRATFTFWMDKSSLKMLKMVNFSEFLKTWSLQSNSVTRQVNINRTKIGGKCQNSNIQMRHFESFSNNWFDSDWALNR